MAAPAYGATARIHRTTRPGAASAFSREERERHVYMVGKSGSGKSTTLFNLAMHDIMAGEGVAVIDPHGDLAEAVADCIPPERTHEVCYLDAADAERPVGFNPLAQHSARAPCARRLRHGFRLQAPVARELGTAA